jgi:selenocysteine-specific elongation factor
VCFSTAALDEACASLGPLLADRPEGCTVAEIRDALDTTRKYVIPLLVILDRTGRTRRRGDRRIAGPRL